MYERMMQLFVGENIFKEVKKKQLKMSLFILE